MVADQWLKSYQKLDEIVLQDSESTEMTTNLSLQIDKLPLKPKEKSYIFTTKIQKNA